MHDNSELFRDTLLYSAKRTGFVAYLIEKDYYCSLILKALTDYDNQLTFKGGTALNKIYLGFYRLSEDLDFMISISAVSSKSQRQKLIKPIKKQLTDICFNHQILELSKPLTGFNLSKQYLAEINYLSVITNRLETIKIDIGLREEVLLPIVKLDAKTLVIDPLNDENVISPFEIDCLDETENFSEKIRAALTRKIPAIRDYFDLYYADQQGINLQSKSYLSLVDKKLQIVNEAIDLSEQKIEMLYMQLESELKPVLREKDFLKFDLNLAINLVKDVADKL